MIESSLCKLDFDYSFSVGCRTFDGKNAGPGKVLCFRFGDFEESVSVVLFSTEVFESLLSERCTTRGL